MLRLATRLNPEQVKRLEGRIDCRKKISGFDEFFGATCDEQDLLRMKEFFVPEAATRVK